MPILVTGAAGFIGAHVLRALRARGDDAIGLDSFNDYYDPAFKRARVAALLGDGEAVREHDLAEAEATLELVRSVQPSAVIHLAAQAGVRYSLEQPAAYTRNNIDGFLSVLEACRHAGVRQLVYASSSSVYGGGTAPPFREDAAIDQPLSLYAATKAANEAMAHAYSHLFGFAVTGLRFFTVYGPWGRPDMAPMLFGRAILAGQTIALFNDGNLERDFTYIDDIVDGVLAALDRPPQGTPPVAVYNLGDNRPVPLRRFVALLEQGLGRQAITELKPMQPGDMFATCADLSRSAAELGYRPRVPIEEGLARFTAWLRDWQGER